jgi:hypothetical protein
MRGGQGRENETGLTNKQNSAEVGFSRLDRANKHTPSCLRRYRFVVGYSARSEHDTAMIRGLHKHGSAASGKKQARLWCEAHRVEQSGRFLTGEGVSEFPPPSIAEPADSSAVEQTVSWSGAAANSAGNRGD